MSPELELRGISYNGSHIDWGELRELLTSMNEAFGMNLLLIMAMCKGSHMVGLLNPLSRAPVWGLVGPTEDVRESDLEQAMKAFYRELLSSFNVNEALDAMNENLPVKDWAYHFQTAELMFCQIMAEYVRKQASGERLGDRGNELVAEIVRRRNFAIETAFEARAYVKQMLANHDRVWHQYRKGFLMIDVFPQFEERFSLTLKRCLEVHGATSD